MINEIKAALAVLRGLLKNVPSMAVSYLLHLALAAIAALALHFGWHISLPVFTASGVSYAGASFIKILLADLAQIWHGARVQAEKAAGGIAVDVERIVGNALATVLQEVDKFLVPSAGADAPAKNETGPARAARKAA